MCGSMIYGAAEQQEVGALSSLPSARAYRAQPESERGLPTGTEHLLTASTRRADEHRAAGS